MIITSKSNPLIKKITSLKQKKYREEYLLYIAEGEKMTADALRAGMPCEYIIGVKEKLDKFAHPQKIEVPREVYKHMSDEVSPEGIMAVIRTAKQKLRAPRGNSLLLDGIKDPGNLGTIIRTAAAAGFNDIYLITCADIYNPKTVRSSMSGLYFCNFFNISYSDVKDLLSNIYVADMCGENIFNCGKPSEPVCLCLGSEAHGVSDFVRNLAQKTVSIPMLKDIESLNAAVSAGILMYQLKMEN